MLAFYAYLLERFGIHRDIRIEVRSTGNVYVYLDGSDQFEIGNAPPSYWTATCSAR